MPDFSRILVPTDLTPCSRRALHHAVGLAKQSGAQLYLIHVLEEIEGGKMAGAGNLRAAYDRLREVLSVEMRMQVREEAGPDFEAEQQIRHASAAVPGILSYASERGVDLIVMGTSSREGAERLLVGSTAERVVRFATCNVLSIGPQNDDNSREERRVLAAVDFSEHARNVLRWAHRIAGYYEARLDLLHVIEPVIRPAFYGGGNGGYDFRGNQLENRARAELKNLYNDINGSRTVGRITIGRGRAAAEIARVALEKQTSVIVQGARGLSAEEEMPLGHVAEEVVRRAPCPVFTVKTARSDE